jgi:hypothetical protein
MSFYEVFKHKSQIKWIFKKKYFRFDSNSEHPSPTVTIGKKMERKFFSQNLTKKLGMCF